MQKINSSALILTALTIFATLFPEAWAQPTPQQLPPVAPSGGPQTIGELLNLFSTLTGWMFAFALVAAVGAIIAGGIMYLFSGGDPRRAEIGMKIVMYALIGVAVAGFAWALVNVVGNILFGESLIPT